MVPVTRRFRAPLHTVNGYDLTKKQPIFDHVRQYRHGFPTLQPLPSCNVWTTLPLPLLSLVDDFRKRLRSGNGLHWQVGLAEVELIPQIAYQVVKKHRGHRSWTYNESRHHALRWTTSALDLKMVGDVLNVMKKLAEQRYDHNYRNPWDGLPVVANRVIFTAMVNSPEDGTPDQIDNPQHPRLKGSWTRY